MKQRNQKWHTWETAGLFAVILLGNTLHFVYDWTGQARWAAFISAVNESTWELNIVRQHIRVLQRMALR